MRLGDCRTTAMPRHTHQVMDLLRPEQLQAAFQHCAERSGGIDILVNNAVASCSHDWRTAQYDDFLEHQANNAGCFLLARRLRDHAVQRGAPASIVMIGSMYGVVSCYPDVYEGLSPVNPVAYQTSKAGLIQMTRHLAVAWAKDRVRVNCLSPGPFPKQTTPAELRQRLSEKSPMGRMGQPHELKGAVLLLASDAGSYITGQNLMVDGGWTAW